MFKSLLDDHTGDVLNGGDRTQTSHSSHSNMPLLYVLLFFILKRNGTSGKPPFSLVCPYAWSQIPREELINKVKVQADR